MHLRVGEFTHWCVWTTKLQTVVFQSNIGLSGQSKYVNRREKSIVSEFCVKVIQFADDILLYLEKRSCQLFYYCVHMAEKTTSLCYVSFYVRCSVFHIGYVSLYVRCSVLDLPAGGSRVLCTCTADSVFSACMHAVRGSVFGCACARNFLLWNCFLHELFRIFRLMAWLISFRRC